MNWNDWREFLITLLPAAAGSALSAFDSKHLVSNKVYIGLEFLFGLFVAMYLGYGLVSHFGIQQGSPQSLGIAFAVGYIGLTILRESKTKVAQAIDLLIDRFFRK